MKKKIVILSLLLLSTLAIGDNDNNKHKGKKDDKKYEKPVQLPMLPANGIAPPGWTWYPESWYTTNYGFTRSAFQKWLNSNKDYYKYEQKSVADFYKKQLGYEKQLRDHFYPYRNEIINLPLYRGMSDPFSVFIQDYLLGRYTNNNGNWTFHSPTGSTTNLGNIFTPNFTQSMSKEQKVLSDFFTLINNFR